MRLWSLHPSLLDTAGLNGAWKEGIGQAQPAIVGLSDGKLKRGVGRGYHNHAQLQRFIASPTPLLLLGTWLTFIHEEAERRGFKYDKGKILEPSKMFKLTVTSGQLSYEFDFLQAKLEKRSPEKHENNEVMYFMRDGNIPPHPMFLVVQGKIEEWEKVK